MIKVAYVALAPFISGSERSLQAMLTAIKQLDVQPFLIAPKHSPLLRWAESEGIETFVSDLPVFSFKHIIHYGRCYFRLKRWLKSKQINIVHSNQLWSYPLIGRVAKDLKLVRVCHFRDPISGAANWWLKGRVNLAICISHHIHTSLINAVEPKLFDNSITLINPINMPLQQTLDQRRLNKYKAKEGFGINKESFVFGFIGQLSDVKGVYEMIEHLSQLKQYDWHLIIAGEDFSEHKSYLTRCQQLIESSQLQQRISFIGFIDDTANFYQAMDMILMFSKEEPLGRVPLEAGSYYTPTVANCTGGLPEIIQHGRTGWLVDMYNTTEVANTLLTSLTMDLTDMGKNAREFSESCSDPTLYAKRLQKIYTGSSMSGLND